MTKIRAEQLSSTPPATALNITSQSKGSVLYFDGSNWVILPPSNDGYVLTTHSVGQNPSWTQVSGSGGISLASITPVNVGNFAGAVGTGTTAARSDHQHGINFGTPVAIGTVNAAGSASTLALSDHTHQVTGLNIAGQTKGDVLFFDGTVWGKLSASTDGYFLTTHTSSSNPTWSKQSTVGTDLNLSGQTQGDITYFNGANWLRLGASSDGYILATHNVGQTPTWISPYPNIITDPTAARTLQLSDQNNIIRFTDGYAITVTVPTNASVPFQLGSSILLRQAGTAQFTLVPAGGVILNTSSSLISAKQHATVSITKVNTNEWDVTGERQ